MDREDHDCVTVKLACLGMRQSESNSKELKSIDIHDSIDTQEKNYPKVLNVTLDTWYQ